VKQIVARIALGVSAVLGITYGAAELYVTDWITDEGWRLDVYLDSIGKPTVCAGHTGPEVRLGDVWTVDECVAVTIVDLNKHGQRVINALKNPALGEFVAWATFDGNTGAFLGSTARRLQNAGKRAEACLQLRRWVYVTVNGRKVDCRTAGKLCRGLPPRRERQLERCMQDGQLFQTVE
jgi:lysozyme